MDFNKNNLEFPIVFQDDDIVVIYKPAGILVHRTSISQDRIFVLQHLRRQIGREVFPIHRLDRATSGLLIFALSSKVARLMGKQLEKNELEKTYHALVRGWFYPTKQIDAPLIREEDGKSQEAETHFKLVEHLDLPIEYRGFATSRYSLIEAKPITGRTHQIRRHLAKLRSYIIGDTKHGDGKQNILFRDNYQCHHMWLNASALLFLHPVSREPLRLQSPIIEPYSKFIDKLSIQSLQNRKLWPAPWENNSQIIADSYRKQFL
jgi:tRNA pseudouridine65 synthase